MWVGGHWQEIGEGREVSPGSRYLCPLLSLLCCIFAKAARVCPGHSSARQSPPMQRLPLVPTLSLFHQAWGGNCFPWLLSPGCFMAVGGALNLPHTFVSNLPIKPSSITPLSVAAVACQDPGWWMKPTPSKVSSFPYTTLGEINGMATKATGWGKAWFYFHHNFLLSLPCLGHKIGAKWIAMATDSFALINGRGLVLEAGERIPTGSKWLNKLRRNTYSILRSSELQHSEIAPSSAEPGPISRWTRS